MGRFKEIAKLDQIFIGLLLTIFGLIVFQGLISVASSFLPEYELLIKAWKEILMGVAAVILLFILWRKRRLDVLKEPLLLLNAGLAVLHLVLILIIGGSLGQILAGLLIDLRYLFYFGLVYVASKLYPQLGGWILKVGLVALLVVVWFGVLQVFVLPHDFLKHLGYSYETIAPYLTVDKNYEFIRISSFLRGPNPLGAYAALGLIVLGVYLVKNPIRGKNLWLLLAAIFGSLVALWFSYSRSALVAVIVGLAVLAVILYGRKLNYLVWATTAGVFVVALAIGWLARDTYFVSNVLLHEDPVGGSAISSNQGHAESLVDGLVRMVDQPLGAGVGSTGSASLLGSETVFIENQYLFVAHEIGWLGLAMFLVIFGLILWRLWQRRSDWLALGVFAGGLALAVVGLVLPVWVDDTVAIIWWGLAGLAVAGSEGVEYLKNGRRKQNSKSI